MTAKLLFLACAALAPAALSAANASASSEAAAPEGRILIVVTNHSELGTTGKQTGYYLSEVAHPWKVFTDAGYAVDFASPDGGYAPMDPKSFDLSDKTNKAFWHNLQAVEGVLNSQDLAKVDLDRYDAIFFAGGHGTMWDFPDSEAVQEAVRTIYQENGVVAAVCHGPAALVNVRLSDGSYLVDGKKVAGFTNEEEKAVQLTDQMPFLLESKLRERGGRFVQADNFEKKVAVDGRLVTGQNPTSASATAEAVLEALKQRK